MCFLLQTAGGIVCVADASVFHFITDHLEALEPRLAERSRDRDVRGIAPRGHQYPANARRVMAGIASPPAVFQKHFEPGAEIHGTRYRWNPNVAKVTGSI